VKEPDIKAIDSLGKLGILKLGEPMKKYTSYKTGGPADAIIWPDNSSSLRDIVLLAKEHSIPLTVLGGCTNLLVGDKGIRGIVIMLNSAGRGDGVIKTGSNGLVYADSSVKKDRFIAYCVNEGYEGIEFMSGIPGCLGGGIIMNAGTIDGYFAGIMETIVCMDFNGCIAENIEFKQKAAYRTMGLPEDSIVLGSFFRLKKTTDIDKVKDKINTLLKERRIKHPLDFPSAGSVFKNPPGYSSWKLVNDSGLKGKGIGGACISELHTNFIINKCNATSMDIMNLINHVKETVLSKYKITLETEIKFIGEF
jgi:UDP-N-acetylmuramate dehydrogenase